MRSRLVMLAVGLLSAGLVILLIPGSGNAPDTSKTYALKGQAHAQEHSSPGSESRSQTADNPGAGAPGQRATANDKLSSLPVPSEVRRLVSGWMKPKGEELAAEIDGYIQRATPPKIDGEIVAVTCPHAGLTWSGSVAAYAFKALQERGQTNYDAVIIVGMSHRAFSPVLSVYYRGAYETPLGLQQIDAELAQEILLQDDAMSFDPKVHAAEWSVQNEIPFIQRAFPDTKIVPIVMPVQSAKNARILARVIAQACEGKRVLLVASSDMSHYHPYDEAVQLDRRALDYILSFDIDGLEKAWRKGQWELDIGPVMTAVAFAQRVGATDATLLKYANSGDIAPAFRSRGVVGYSSVAFSRPVPGSGTEGAGDSTTATEGETGQGSGESADELTAHQKEILLNLARRAIERHVRNGERLDPEPPSDERLRQLGAAFVTIRKRGMLRGCIGHLEPRLPLYQTVSEMAIAAAAKDFRFPPVTEAELNDIEVEVSAMTPPRKVGSVDDVVLGLHGVIVAKGVRRGVFLPQVAAETGWTKTQFMEHLCSDKAGLPKDAYLTGADIYVFTAEVFSESDLEAPPGEADHGDRGEH